MLAHIWRRFGIEFRHDSPFDSDFGLEIDGHGGAHWQAIWVPFPARSSDRFLFRSEFRWPRWRTSGSDLGTVGDGGAHWGTIRDRVSTRFGNRWPRWRTLGSDFGSISNTVVRWMLVSIWVPIATVAHIGKRFGCDLRFHFACDVGGDPRPT